MTGDVCEFTCSEGFTASGSHSCQPDGSFAGGACSGVDCGASVAGLDPHATASCGGDTTVGVNNDRLRTIFLAGLGCVAHTDPSLLQGDDCVATCAEGFRADSEAASYVCGQDGQWAGELVCNAQAW